MLALAAVIIVGYVVLQLAGLAAIAAESRTGSEAAGVAAFGATLALAALCIIALTGG